MKTNYTETERQEHLEKWKASGLSKAAYADTAGINKTTFYKWANGTGKGKQGFVEIPARIKQEQVQEIIIEKGEVRIHVPLSVWAEGSTVIMEGLRAVI